MSFAPVEKDKLSGTAKEAGKEAALDAAKQAGTQLASAAADKAGGKVAEVKDKVQEVSSKVQQAQQYAGMAQGLIQGLKQSPDGGGGVPGATPGINPNGGMGNAPGAAAPQPEMTASQVGAALMPLLVGYEVAINGTIITPVASISISQGHGAHHQLKLSFYHELVQAEGTFTIEEAGDLLGKPATVTIKNLNNDGADKLQCLFVIGDVEMDQQDGEEGMLTLTGYSPTYLLDGAPHFESFNQKNLKEIAAAVCKPLEQVKGSLKADPTLSATFPFVCRYNESAWNFLKRLASETGQWLYWNGEALVFGKAEAPRAIELVYGRDCYQVQLAMKIAPVQTGIFDYHAGQDSLIGEKAMTPTQDGGSYAAAAFKQSKTLFSAPAHAMSHSLGGEKSIVEAIGKAKADATTAGLYVMKGESTLYHLRVGSLIKVSFSRKGQNTAHGQMRIVSIHHHLSGDGHYSNAFEAIPAEAGALPLGYYRPQTHPVLAKVIDNSDGQGRVKVEFLGWGGEGKQTDWIRVLTPDAGGGGDKVAKNRGLVTVPEKGDQVYVDWESGNPDKPFVTGSVFHGKHGSGGGGGNNSKSLTSKSGHTVHLDDGAGITMMDKSKLNHIVVDGTDTITITAGQKIVLTNGKSTITMDGDAIIMKAAKISVEGTTQVVLGSGSSTATIVPAGVGLKGTDITLQGGSQVSVDGGGATIIAAGDVGIKGGMVNIN